MKNGSIAGVSPSEEKAAAERERLLREEGFSFQPPRRSLIDSDRFYVYTIPALKGTQQEFN